MEKALEKFFHLEERGTNVRTELIAGATTFVTAAYILAVNPSILSETGMPQGAVFTATVLISFIGTLLMALYTLPKLLVPYMRRSQINRAVRQAQCQSFRLLALS